MSSSLDEYGRSACNFEKNGRGGRICGNDEESCQSLKNRTNRMNSMKRGLVLEGGGAKGAFAFGCLKTLKKAHVHFDAVSGTSVGALNGLLFATDSWNEADDLWTTIDHSKVYPIRQPQWLFRLIKPFVILCHVILLYLTGIELPTSSVRPKVMAGCIWAAIVTLPGLVFLMALAVGMFLQRNYGMAACVVGLALFVFIDAARTRARYAALKKVIFDISFFTPMIVLAVLFPEPISGLPALIGFLAFLLVLSWMAGKSGNVIDGFIKWSERQLNALTVLENRPLFKTICSVANRPCLVPFYATLAKRCHVYNPDSPTYECTSPNSFDPNPRILKYDEWEPVYFPVHELSDEVKPRVLLGSASLPFGIVPFVEIQSQRYVDGGVVDNCPIYPLISLAQCDEIVVVSLTPNRSEEDIREHWRSVDQRIRLCQMVSQFNEGDNFVTVEEECIPKRDPEIWPRILVLDPPESLGGLLNGTLNFTAKYANEKIAMGIDRTNEKLAEWKS